MTVNEVYKNLASFLLSILPEGNWQKAELDIEIQPGMVGLSGTGYYPTEQVPLRTKSTSELKDQIRWLHALTTEGGTNKWNRAKFIFKPDNSFALEFEWDEAWQSKVDYYNEEARKNNPSYTPPKWPWEK
jgi:hypothetical protein